MKVQTLYLIRGVPGSGKTTLGLKLLAQGLATSHFEADMYFTDDSGRYSYDKTRVGLAHEWCRQQTLEAIQRGESVVVCNTFSQPHELTPYLDMAGHYGINLVIIRADGSYSNVHDVPEDIVASMRLKFKDISGETLYSEL